MNTVVVGPGDLDPASPTTSVGCSRTTKVDPIGFDPEQAEGAKNMPGLAREIRVKRQRDQLIISTRAASARGGTTRVAQLSVPPERLEETLKNPDVWRHLGMAIKRTGST